MCYYIYETIPPPKLLSYPTDEKQYFLDVDMYVSNTCLTPYIYSLASQPVTVDITPRLVSIIPVAPATPVVKRNLRPNHNSWSPAFVPRNIVQIPEGSHLEVKSAQIRGITDEQAVNAEEGIMRVRGGMSEASVLGLTDDSVEMVEERSEYGGSERKRKRVEKKNRLVSPLWGSRRVSVHLNDPLSKLQVVKEKRRNMSLSKKQKVSNAEESEGEKKIVQPVSRKFGPLRAVGRKISPLSLGNSLLERGSYNEETLYSDCGVSDESLMGGTPKNEMSNLSAGKLKIHGEEHDKYTLVWKTDNFLSLPDIHVDEPFPYLTSLSQMNSPSLGHCSVLTQIPQPQSEILLRGGEPIPTYIATLLHAPEQFNIEPLGKQERDSMVGPRLSREDLISMDMGAAGGIGNEVVGGGQSPSQYESFLDATKSESLWDMMYDFPSDKFVQFQDEEGDFPIPHIIIPPPLGGETNGGAGGGEGAVGLHYEDSPVAVEIPVPGGGDGLEWNSEGWPGWDERDSPIWIEQDWGKWVENVRGPYGCETF